MVQFFQILSYWFVVTMAEAYIFVFQIYILSFTNNMLSRPLLYKYREGDRQVGQ